MSRRSILASVSLQQPTRLEPSGRRDKLHIGGYFDPSDQTIIVFQKSKIDLRKSQQEMLLEALRDFFAKHEAA